MADFIVGSVVREGDFWFREELLKNIWESLKKHNVLLLAPRRIGKTSVMYRMLDYPKRDWLVIHLNVEDLKTAGDFFITLVDAINEHQPEYVRDTLLKSWDFLKGVFNRIEKVEISILKVALRRSENLNEKWEERLSQLIDRMIESEQKVLIIVDELPDMLNGMLANSRQEYDTFLHWFRKIRERSLRANLRWLIGGSVNLVAALDYQGKVKLINDLKIEPLPPFSKAEVEKFVRDMFKKNNVRFDEKAVSQIYELLGSPIPLFLQMLTQELNRQWKRNNTVPISIEIVGEVFNKALMGEMARDKLQHYRSRIDLHYPPEDREAACYLLNKLSLSEGGISRNSLRQLYRQVEEKKSGGRTSHVLNQAFQRLLLYLQSDFYIEEVKEDRYDFASRLLKTWWKKYYGYENGGN